MRHTVVQNSSGRQVVWCRRGFATSCLLHCSHLTVSANSEDSWKRFCLSRTRLQRLVTLAFRCQIQILLLTYFFTYLLQCGHVEVDVGSVKPRGTGQHVGLRLVNCLYVCVVVRHNWQTIARWTFCRRISTLTVSHLWEHRQWRHLHRLSSGLSELRAPDLASVSPVDVDQCRSLARTRSCHFGFF